MSFTTAFVLVSTTKIASLTLITYRDEPPPMMGSGGGSIKDRYRSLVNRLINYKAENASNVVNHT